MLRRCIRPARVVAAGGASSLRPRSRAGWVVAERSICPLNTALSTGVVTVVVWLEIIGARWLRASRLDGLSRDSMGAGMKPTPELWQALSMLAVDRSKRRDISL